MLKTLRQGDSGVELSALRGLLGLPDGDSYDADVALKVIAVQKQNGLTPDGIVGPDTWTALAKSAKPIRPGASGAHVRALQYLLDRPKPDGIYGPKTQKAVSNYRVQIALKPGKLCGAQTWAALITGRNPAPPSRPGEPAPPVAGAYVKPVYYSQGDKRWANRMYSITGSKNQTMKTSGCGPTAAAMAVATYKDTSALPPVLADLAIKWGCRTKNSGTAWSFFRKAGAHYGFKGYSETNALATIKAALDKGAVIVCSMGPGYWTKQGHYITLWKYDATHFYAQDPASTARKRQQIAPFMKQLKRAFVLTP